MTTTSREEAPRGRAVWRTLDEWAETDEFRDIVSREFPSVLPEYFDAATRRQFLRVMGASVLLAGATGCAYQPPESIVPYVVQPPKVTLGKPLMYATAVPSCGYGMGVIVETHEGRPTHVSGNPDHPASLGATDPFMTASILDLYDPDRSQAVLRNGRASTWDDFLAAWNDRRSMLAAAQGEGLRILTGAVTSPTLTRMIGELLKLYPKARWHAHEPTEGNSEEGMRLALGSDLQPVYQFELAEVIVSLDSDFFSWGPARLAYARDFAWRRQAPAYEKLDKKLPHFAEPTSTTTPGDNDHFWYWRLAAFSPKGEFKKPEMNRLHVVEPAPTITGAMADHRLAASPSRIRMIARAIAEDVSERPRSVELDARESAWVTRVVADLKAHRSRGIVIAGEAQPPVIHALALAISQALGNLDSRFERPVKLQSRVAKHPNDDSSSLAALTSAIDAGRVTTLLILGSNPVYTGAVDLSFGAMLTNLDSKTAMTVHLGGHEDETAKRCHWHLPEAHPLETWGDLRAYEGTASICQPMIRPLYGGRSAIEVLASLVGREDANGLALVRETWTKRILNLPDEDVIPDRSLARFEAEWREAVHSGVGPRFHWDSTERVPIGERAQIKSSIESLIDQAKASSVPPSDLELVLRPDPTVWDGRSSNNGWLQELPKPITKLTWDNAVRIAPSTAERLGIKSEQIVELDYRGRALRAAAWIDPGHDERSVTLSLGYGRSHAGRVGSGQGFNAYKLQYSSEPWGGSGLQIRPTSATYKLANTQHHQVMEGRDLIRAATLADFMKHPEFAQDHHDPAKAALTLYEEHRYDGHKWGMSINLNTCIGCNACVMACQSENNCPVVGKDQVVAGRDLHWIRIDRYYEGPPEEPKAIYHQPVLCMHCENAPCEVVCPVNATVHDAEGLNVMVYNRCVGTRYCSNNCPYKVRRFNFLGYGEHPPDSLKLMYNPEVTVRTRGVMEKCSYCVQRIVNGRIEADKEGRPLRDGEIVTACQSACPTRAIVFGDLNDKDAAVTKLKADPRDYALLGELNTRPRTTYLAKITNSGEG